MILFIDDERIRMASYVEKLEFCNYQVKFESDVDIALDFFQNNHKQIKLVILDVMMPTSDIFDGLLAENGLKSGICFHYKIRQCNQNIPVIMFTNIRDNELINIVKHYRTIILYKDMILPSELANNVNLLMSIQDQKYNQTV